MHALLAHELGLKSPLADGVAMLDRAAKLSFNRTAGLHSAQQARREIARAVALGEAPFNEATIRAFEDGRLWCSDYKYHVPAAVSFADAVAQQAQQAAGTELLKHAPGIFDTLAAEAARVIGIFESLPEPPPNLILAGDPTGLLTRAPGHEATYSAMLAANARFGAATRAANLVRGPAGPAPNISRMVRRGWRSRTATGGSRWRWRTPAS